MATEPADRRLTGRVAIVTGAAQGIGEAVVRRLVAEGAQVMCVDRDESVIALADELGSAAASMVADVGNSVAVARFVADTHARWGRLDVLVNNAGIDGVPALLEDGIEADFDRVIDVNLRACWSAMKHALPLMVAGGGGSIVNVSSVAALVGFETLSIYAASKAGLVGMTRSAALEYGPRGIRINAICPGGVMTPLARSFMDEGTVQDWAMKHALQRFAEPAEIAAVVAFLASDDASFITGAAIPVDGGMTAR